MLAGTGALLTSVEAELRDSLTSPGKCDQGLHDFYLSLLLCE